MKKPTKAEIYKAVATPQAGRADLAQYNMLLPLPYIEIACVEAELLAADSVSKFLTFLLYREIGVQVAERSPMGKTYTYRASDFDKTERVTWYMKKAVKEIFDNHRLEKFGAKPPQFWVVEAIKAWLGDALVVRR
jgi:hypothetical protein